MTRKSNLGRRLVSEESPAPSEESRRPPTAERTAQAQGGLAPAPREGKPPPQPSEQNVQNPGGLVFGGVILGLILLAILVELLRG